MGQLYANTGTASHTATGIDLVTVLHALKLPGFSICTKIALDHCAS